MTMWRDCQSDTSLIYLMWEASGIAAGLAPWCLTVYTSSHRCVHFHMAVCPCVWASSGASNTMASTEGVDGSQNSSSPRVSELPPPLSVHHLITNTHTHSCSCRARTAASTHPKSTARYAPSLITNTYSLSYTTTTLLSVGAADKMLSGFLILFCVTAQESWNNTGNLKVGVREKRREIEKWSMKRRGEQK